MTSEEELVKKVMAGDSRASKQLIVDYQALVFHMIARVIKNKEDAEDVAQEVFIKIFHYLPSFKFQSKLSTWIASIAYRMALNYLDKKRLLISDKELDQVAVAQLEKADTSLIKAETKEYVQELIDQLPAQYRLVLMLYHMEEFDYQEIQEITGMPEGTVKNYLFRARKLLKEKISPNTKNTLLYG
ncbi:RNA polymerase sigma factor [Cytophagales bacterium LB-30]|uniref:RNA polymerase sigma factor n=1 Tax=Shiella aurantiaca TaxID=3058365 RepID=A0ABT8F8K6_9BACT|nr:RNA polymerase sigma factor [Shiella aurantiaca]MDN4166718.1 RNA polymerase sigma factor [Shiella aurantiaca]